VLVEGAFGIVLFIVWEPKGAEQVNMGFRACHRLDWSLEAVGFLREGQAISLAPFGSYTS
jgi:hypothetical protein